MEENKEYTVGLLMINTTLFVATTLAMAVMGGQTYKADKNRGSQLTGNRFGKQGTERKIAERITELRNRTDRTERNAQETGLRNT